MLKLKLKIPLNSRSLLSPYQPRRELEQLRHEYRKEQIKDIKQMLKLHPECIMF